jgi:hypothetical protein
MRACIVLSLLSLAARCLGSDTAGFGKRPPRWITYDVPNEFNNPTGLARPTFRYWIPDADVNETVL